MKFSTKIKFLFPFLVLGANVVFLIITSLIPETHQMQVPFFMKLNFGVFAFSLLLIIVWGWYQWNYLGKVQIRAILNDEEPVYNSFSIKSNSTYIDNVQVETPVDDQSGQSTKSYFISNGWSLPNADDFPY